MPYHKSTDYKLTAVNYYLVEDTTQEDVCKILKCSVRSLMRWVKQYKKEGNVDIHYRKPVAYKVTPFHISNAEPEGSAYFDVNWQLLLCNR